MEITQTVTGAAASGYVEGSRLKLLNFPDPFKYGDEYRHVFPLRHHTLKAVLDNLPETVERVYVYGSSLRLDTAFNSDLDIFIIGSVTNEQLGRIYRAVPERERLDVLVETRAEFESNLAGHWNDLYRKVYEGGYKVYERQ